MKRLRLFLLLLASAALLTACTGLPSNAPIDDRTGPKSAPVVVKANAVPAVPDQPGFYTVKKGDTLLRIAQQFNQSWRDLVDWNNLSNANDIKLGQTLRVVRPEGAQVGAVNNPESSIEVRPLDGAQAIPRKNVSSATGIKTNPSGEKRVYSDQALAEMQQTDNASPVRALDNSKKTAEAPAAGAVGKANFIWPTDGKVIKVFEQSRKGIDIAGQSGQPVMVVSDGTVLYAKNMRGYGNLIIVDHNEGLVSAYGHNKTILVKEGQSVIKGQKIAEMGDSDADTVKLHFEIRQLGKPVDPVGLLPNR